jgi:hypothetical protein
MEDIRDMKLSSAFLSLLLIVSGFAPLPSMAGSADVVGVEVFKLKKSGDTVFRFKVTVAHGDEGWDHYADAWEVVGPDGSVLGRRVLLHPHVNEQPFTRSTDLDIPKSITEVTIRARDKTHGLGGVEAKVSIPHN